MEMRSISILAALACALVGGGTLAIALFGAITERTRTQRAAARFGTEGSLTAVALRRGVGILQKPAEWLLKMPAFSKQMGKIKEGLRQKGLESTDKALATVLIFACLVIFTVSAALTQSAVCGIALAGCLFLAVGMWANKQDEMRHDQLREAIPEALQSMKACFQVGYSLKQTIQEVASTVKGPLAELFAQVEGVLETGGSVEEALDVLKRQTSEPELIFLATALEIQHKTGSSMQQILEITRQSVADEIDLKRSLKTQTAQARLSAQIVTIMPFALIGIFSLVSPGFLDPFFESALGMLLLAGALCMQVMGVLLVRRLLKVKVV